MKKLCLLFALLLTLTGCGVPQATGVFQALVLEVREDAVLVEPSEGTAERRAADRLLVSLQEDRPGPDLRMGDTVEITYDGDIQEARLTGVTGITVLSHAKVLDPTIAPEDLLDDFHTLDGFPMHLTFSNGAGAWMTDMVLETDGSFSGQFQDTELGEFAESYPNGTTYYNHFTGRFDSLYRIDDLTYAMTLTDLYLADGGETIRDGVRYVGAKPSGLTRGAQYILHLPGTRVDELPEDFRSWYNGWPSMELPDSETMLCWGLHNTADGSGFFTLPED